MMNVMGQVVNATAIVYEGEVRYINPLTLQWGARPGIDTEKTWLLRTKTRLEEVWITRTYRLIDIKVIEGRE